jgi:hypothetical protein
MPAKSRFSTVKLPTELVTQARQEAAIFSRSIAGQLEHWARIGRAMENAPGFTLDRARAAIEGRFDPAELSSEERAFYYDLLDDVMANPKPAEVDVAVRRGAQAGAVGYDDKGCLVRRLPNGEVEAIEE